MLVFYDHLFVYFLENGDYKQTSLLSTFKAVINFDICTQFKQSKIVVENRFIKCLFIVQKVSMLSLNLIEIIFRNPHVF